jgi:hypothetical protein
MLTSTRQSETRVSSFQLPYCVLQVQLNNIFLSHTANEFLSSQYQICLLLSTNSNRNISSFRSSYTMTSVNRCVSVHSQVLLFSTKSCAMLCNKETTQIVSYCVNMCSVATLETRFV